MRDYAWLAVAAFMVVFLSCVGRTVSEIEAVDMAVACDAACRPLGGQLDFTTGHAVCRCVMP